MIPTSVPTLVPIFAKPTLPGETQRPTNHPTHTPSLNYNSFNSTYSYNILEENDHFRPPGQSSVSFAHYSYKGKAIEGTCDDWRIFSAKSLILPTDSVFFTELSVVVGYNSGKSSDKVSTTCR